MKILALECELPGATAEVFQCYAHAEALKVWELHQTGLIRELYFRPDQSTAILILECASTDEANAVLAELPVRSAPPLAQNHRLPKHVGLHLLPNHSLYNTHSPAGAGSVPGRAAPTSSGYEGHHQKDGGSDTSDADHPAG
jgi:hypothetical protein